MYHTISHCRACHSEDLAPVLSLGALKINAFLRPDEPDPPAAPLELVRCRKCELVQLRHTVNPDLLYRTFWYRSGITQSMRAALQDVVVGARAFVSVRPRDIVVDLGSNDSTLLRFWETSVRRIGFEPALNLRDEALAGGCEIISDYFSRKGYAGVAGEQKARVVTAIAMAYDLDEPNAFFRDVRAILADDGVFVVQVGSLAAMLETNDFSTVCHEHLLYYSLQSLLFLLRQNGLHAFEAETNTVNGGSIRVYASPQPRAERPGLLNLFKAEQRLHLDTDPPYQAFAQRVENIKATIRDWVNKARTKGPVYVLGASTKFNSCLQHWGLDHSLLAGASERDPRKHGLETVGTRIPIVSEEEARQHATTFLLGPWHFRQEILAREKDWLAEPGHRIIIPLPVPEVIGAPLKEEPRRYPVSTADALRVENDFTYHPPTPDQLERYAGIRRWGREWAQSLLALCPYSRERSLALTKIEEAVMWANASISRNEETPAAKS